MKLRRSVRAGSRLGRCWGGGVLSVLAGGAFASTAMAQEMAQVMTQEQAAATGEPGASGIVEVIVTARRRAENLQETPVSISALSSDDLEKRSVENLSDLAAYVPNVSITSVGPGISQIFIRGIGQNDYRVFADGGVGLYVDGVYIARNIGGLLDVLDLERIEVLRGPQGTLYGKNTIGGAVSLVSRKPSDEFGGQMTATYGSFDRMDVKADVNLPVTDRFAMKLAAASLNRDGYGQRLRAEPFQLGSAGGTTDDNRDLGNVDTQLGRAQFRYRGDSYDINLALDRIKLDSNGSTTHLEAIDPNGALVGLYNAVIGNAAGRPMDERYIASNRYNDYGTGPEFVDTDIWGSSLTVDVELGALSLKSISAYRDLENVIASDSDRLPVFIIEQQEFNAQHQVSQELQLSAETDRLKWVGGLYYFREKSSRLIFGSVVTDVYHTGFFGVDGQGRPVEPGVANDLDFDSKSYAAYTQATVKLTDKLSTTLGARYTDETKEIHGWLYSHFTRRFLGNADNDESWDSFSPRVGFEYQWNDDLMTYVSAAQGFKSGGFNGRFTAGVPNGGALPYDPETVWTYEAGFRSQFADNRVRLNATAFLNKYEDIQFQQDEVVGGQVIVVTGNAAKATMYGVETELVWVPMQGLNVDASIGYINSKYDDVGNAVGLSLDSSFITTPEWSATTGVEYVWPVGASGATLSLRGDAAYRSRVAFDVNPNQYTSQDAYTLANARLTYSAAENGWQVALFATNLANERYRITGVDSLADIGFAVAEYGRPREWGVTGTWRF